MSRFKLLISNDREAGYGTFFGVMFQSPHRPNKCVKIQCAMLTGSLNLTKIRIEFCILSH